VQLSASEVEAGEDAVVEDCTEFISEPEVGLSLEENGSCDAGGLLGHIRDGARLQRHGSTSLLTLLIGQMPPHPDHFCATTSRSVRRNLD
jgi:hypothetical protein